MLFAHLPLSFYVSPRAYFLYPSPLSLALAFLFALLLRRSGPHHPAMFLCAQGEICYHNL